MARGQYKGSRKSVQELRMRKVVKLAGGIDDEAHLARIVMQLPPEQRGEFMKVIRPYLKFELQATR